MSNFYAGSWLVSCRWSRWYKPLTEVTNGYAVFNFITKWKMDTLSSHILYTWCNLRQCRCRPYLLLQLCRCAVWHMDLLSFWFLVFVFVMFCCLFVCDFLFCIDSFLCIFLIIFTCTLHHHHLSLSLSRSLSHA